MQTEKQFAPMAKASGLARLSLLLLVSIVGIAAFWHVLYGVSLLAALAVVGEIGVLLTVAFLSAWRWSR
jgi:hypothetical protein